MKSTSSGDAGGPLDQTPVVRNAGLTLVGSAVGGVLVVVGELLAARLLQREAYGLYASGITVAKIGEAFAVFGLPVGIFHFIPVYRQRSETRLTVGTVYAAAVLPLLLGCAVSAAIWIAAPWLGSHVFHAPQVVAYLRLTGLSVPFMACSEVFGAITRGFGNTKYYVIINNLIPPGVFLIGLAVMSRAHLSPLWIAGAVAIANGLGFLAGIYAVIRVVGSDLWRVPPIFPVAELYRYSSEIMLNTFFYMLFAWTGILAVGTFLGTDNVGVYRMCLQVIVPFDMIVLAFHAAMGPIYPVLAKENRLAELEDAYGAAVRWMILLHLPIGIVIAWNRRDLLALLGPQFMSGASAILILAVGFSLSACFGTAAYLLMLSGRKSVETRNAAFTTLLNLVLAVVLIPRFGLAGAAFATTFAFFLLNVLRAFEVRYLVGLRIFGPYLIRVVTLGLVVGLGTFVVLHVLGVFDGNDPAAIVLRIASMSAVYAAILWKVGLNNSDKQTIQGLIRSVVRA